MAGNILTPTTIWKDFSIPCVPSAETVDERREGKIVYTRLYIDGKEEKDGKTKIFGVIAKNADGKKAPAIMLVQDFETGYDGSLVSALVKSGFSVLSLDIAGRCGEEYFTQYPPSVYYANYDAVKNDLSSVDGEVTDTCWYEWACNVRYALAYLVAQPFVSAVGGFGMGEAATVMWQVAGTDKNLTCSAFALNAGWRGYRGIYKFGGNVEPQFSDNMYKFIAGIEPQAYAMHINRPVLMLAATNSNEYDCDRASDTVARIADGVFKAVHYSVGYRARVSGEALRVATIFFNEFLYDKGGQFKADTDISCEIKNGKIEVRVYAPGTVKSVDLYASEEIYDPAKRCWQRVCGGVMAEDDNYIFSYSPYHKSAQATFFAQITYKNGFVSGTKIINKKFTERDVLPSHKSKILYSSRVCGAESVFSAANQGAENNAEINVEDKKRVRVKKGPMGIEGVCCEWGLVTFKFATERDRPIEGSIFMTDVYAKEKGLLTVKLIADYFGAKTEYLAYVKLLGGEVWQNVKLEINRFKTAEGMSLKTFDKINAVEISSDGEFVINNALWV